MSPLIRNILLLLTIVATISAIFYLESQKATPTAPLALLQETPSTSETASGTPAHVIPTSTPKTASKKTPPLPEVLAKATRYKKYVEIASPSGFINTEGKALTIGELIGKKVVLVDFWTYSCINCQRTLPFLTSWYTTYKDAGLEIVGIHTPEFEFEKKRENVEQAAERAGITYPIVQDNNYTTWRAYNNFYWPHKYLIDIDGFIVYDHIGEGNYSETEGKIKTLLAERAERLHESVPRLEGITITAVSGEVLDNSKPRTAELYFGSLRNEFLGNGKQKTVGEQTFTLPATPMINLFYLGETWEMSDEYAKNVSADAHIVLKYQAQKVFMVARANIPTRARVLVDGLPIPENLRGKDVSADGTITFSEDRLYRIIEGDSWMTKTLELIIEKPGLEAFTFTFG